MVSLAEDQVLSIERQRSENKEERESKPLLNPEQQPSRRLKRRKEIIGVFLQQMSLGEDNWNGEPRCEKQRLEEPPGSGDPLHLIFEEYADDQVTY